ncbi:MAG: hypothetical protein IJ809_00760 [Clostridia bacterium]|nr:hypothetical protein [Clostridia bacterium]
MATFSYETNLIIKEMEEEEKRRRVCRLSKAEKEELLDFIDEIVSKYEMIMDEITYLVNLKNKNGKKAKEYVRFKVTNSELYLLESILSTNHFDSKPKIVRVKSGKRVKKYDCYRIKRIARLFYVANYVGKKCVETLIAVPDVHFALVQIKKDEFGQLSKYMNIATPHAV